MALRVAAIPTPVNVRRLLLVAGELGVPVARWDGRAGKYELFEPPVLAERLGRLGRVRNSSQNPTEGDIK